MRRRRAGQATSPDGRVEYSRRRLAGTVVVVAIFWMAFGGILTLALAIYPVRSGGFPVDARIPYTRTYDPITVVERGLPPNVPIDLNALDAAPKDAGIHLISVRPDDVSLIVGGRPVRTIPAPMAITDIGRLCDLIADPDWIERSGPRQIILKSALVIYRGVDFTAGAPSVDDLELLDQPGVLLGVNGGRLRFDRIRVHADSTNPPSPDRYRPFILAIGRGALRFDHSTVDGLGWDWNGSYGVSWQDGSTGGATDTTFENSFIGVYTARTRDLSFLRCTFRDNELYGFDPHTYSRNVVVEDSLAEGNGAHGFIFSEYVRQSVIKNSISRGNGENGIMMDTYSSGNLVSNNQVIGNKGDGLVTTNSPRNAFQSNVIEGNRVGVRTSSSDAPSTRFEGNDVLFNDRASENLAIVNGRESNNVRGNGGQWNLHALRTIWIGIAAAVGISAALLGVHARKWRAKQPLGGEAG